MARLWTRLAAVYGSDRWERAFGTDAPDEWRCALGHVTLAGIARGIERAEGDDSGRLPTLGVFRGWCREYAVHQPTRPALTHQEREASASTARAWRAFWWLEGIEPTPAGVTMDDIEAALAERDIGDMREQVARERRKIERRLGVESAA